MRPMKRKLQWSSVALVLPLAAILSGCQGEANVEQEIIRPVKAQVIGEPVRGHVLTYSGVVRPRIETAVGFRVAGKVVQRLVNVGDRVVVNQVIARLDDTDLKLAENSAKAAVAAARSRRNVASDNLERGKALLPKAIISQAAYDTRRNEMDAAVAALDSAEAQLRQATNAVEYATLKADKAGIVTGVIGEPGQVVSAGQTIITLAHAGETEIAVAVPEQDTGYLAIGQRANITLWAGPRMSLEGRVREIAGQADPASRTYAVRVTVSGAPQIMRLGMTASVALRMDDEAAGVMVPLTALTESEGGPVVFVVDPANEAVRKTPVSMGGIAEDGVKIVDGLHAGDVVVTAGVQFLRDGMRVRLSGELQHAPPGQLKLATASRG
jgi:membrane fusion protein, multidrug efflux system